jgi:hypothetical protein
MENFYYSAIYGLIRETNVDKAKPINLIQLKAKIIQLNSIHYRALQLDVEESDRLRGEDPSLNHHLTERKR